MRQLLNAVMSSLFCLCEMARLVFLHSSTLASVTACPQFATNLRKSILLWCSAAMLWWYSSIARIECHLVKNLRHLSLENNYRQRNFSRIFSNFRGSYADSTSSQPSAIASYRYRTLESVKYRGLSIAQAGFWSNSYTTARLKAVAHFRVRPLMCVQFARTKIVRPLMWVDMQPLIAVHVQPLIDDPLYKK